VVDENIVQNDVPQEAQPAPEPPPIVKVAPPESRFLFVDVAALRAKQLRRGARLRITGFGDGEPPAELPKKPERLAMEEVRQGLVPFDLPDPKVVEEESE
jgi:DNA-directed RNA polymerase subunit K/omega